MHLTARTDTNLLYLVRKKTRSIIWKLALISLVLLLIFFSPSLIESVISRRLDFPGIKTSVTEIVKTRTGFEATVQGARFQLFQGIVLSGFRVYPGTPESGNYFFQSENLVFEVSYWKL